MTKLSHFWDYNRNSMTKDGCLCLPSSTAKVNRHVVLQASLLQHASENWEVLNYRFIWTKLFERALGITYGDLVTSDYCPGAWKLISNKPALTQYSKSSIARIDEFLRYNKLQSIVHFIKNLDSIVGMTKLTEMKLTGTEALLLDPEQKVVHGVRGGMIVNGKVRPVPDIPLHFLDEVCKAKKGEIMNLGLTPGTTEENLRKFLSRKHSKVIKYCKIDQYKLQTWPVE